jgi:hypothetical protein
MSAGIFVLAVASTIPQPHFPSSNPKKIIQKNPKKEHKPPHLEGKNPFRVAECAVQEDFAHGNSNKGSPTFAAALTRYRTCSPKEALIYSIENSPTALAQSVLL